LRLQEQGPEDIRQRHDPYLDTPGSADDRQMFSRTLKGSKSFLNAE
jgi:hypothetical protein